MTDEAEDRVAIDEGNVRRPQRKAAQKKRAYDFDYHGEEDIFEDDVEEAKAQADAKKRGRKKKDKV